MSISLDTTERRIVGCLIEKQMTVPETYPLSMNALVAACNQRSNRDPEMALEEYLVEGAVQSLMAKGWALQMERAGGRTLRYSHDAGGQLGVEEHDLALLAELLLRGPQSAMELKTRASRMRPFATTEDVERRLQELAARPVPYVRLLGKRPGERVPRWEHLLSAERAAEAPPPSTSAAAVAATPSAAPPEPRAVAPRGGPSDPITRMILERLDRLEREVEALREERGGSGAT